jgi:hypothetical protein
MDQGFPVAMQVGQENVLFSRDASVVALIGDISQCQCSCTTNVLRNGLNSHLFFERIWSTGLLETKRKTSRNIPLFSYMI